MAFNPFTTRTMLELVKAGQKSSNTFLRDRYFPSRQSFSTEYVDFDLVGIGGRRIAPFVNPKVGGTVVSREGYTTLSYRPPEVSPMRVTTAEDCLMRRPGENLYSSHSPEQRAAEILGQDLSDLDDIISRREEAMCAEALFTGQIRVKGDGYDETVKYWSQLETKDQPKTTLTTKWDEEEVDAVAIMRDLQTIRRSMVQLGGFTPREMIVGSKVADILLEKFAKSEALNNRRVVLGQIDPHMLGNGVGYIGNLAGPGLDIYTYDEWYVDEDGKEKPMVPENGVLLAASGVRTMIAYGCTAVKTTGASGEALRFYAEPRVPATWVQEMNPSGRIVQIKSRPLPIIQQIYGFHVVDALTA